jgi:hypothetical protein
MGGLLTASQIAAFKREGFVVVPGFFAHQAVDAWRAQVWADTRADPK